MRCADVYNLFFQPGEVTEIRVIGASGKSRAWEGWARNIVFGYFDSAEAFGKAAEALEEAKCANIYFVLNPVHRDLFARAANRMRVADAKTPQTTDEDVLFLRWVYVDIDVKRKSGISSTAEELEAAIALRNEISKWLKAEEMGFGQGVPAMSGNGAHLLLRIPDLPNTKANSDLVHRCLEALGAKFNRGACHVDTTTANPSRICKLYGTTARKGDHTPERPHRKSYIEPKYMGG